MRIVAGAQRGRTLEAPRGQATRPTADRARQALFNVLEHAAWAPGLSDARVLDLFAGSGALGLEALSRGAAFALLVDIDPAAVAVIGRNLAALGLTDRGAARRRDAARPGDAAAEGGAFDLAFLDPPYGRGLAEPALTALAVGGWLTPGALAVVERGSDEAVLAAPGFAVLDGRVWGAAKVWFLRFGD
jgi:16S rRNA (guanine966-N2)-methyltransferase